MMHPMHQMKFPPLPRRQRPQNRMLQNRPPAKFPVAQFALTSPDHFIHLRDPLTNLHAHTGHTPRHYPRRRAPPLRHVTQPHHQQNARTLPQRGPPRRRLSRLQRARKSPDRPCIRQVEMLQHFVRAPLPRRMPAPFFRRHALCRFTERLLQLLEVGIHLASLALPPLQLECCPTSQTTEVITGTGRMP